MTLRYHRDTLKELVESWRDPEEERFNRIVERLLKLYEATEENIRRWQEWRDKGLVKPEVAFHVLATIFDNMGDAASGKKIGEEPLKGLYKQWDAIREREGLNEDYEFEEGEAPKDYIAVDKKIEALLRTAHVGPMKQYGETEMAGLYLKDWEEFERQKQAGGKILYAEPELAKARKRIDEVCATQRAVEKQQREQREEEGQPHERHKDD